MTIQIVTDEGRYRPFRLLELIHKLFISSIIFGFESINKSHEH